MPKIKRICTTILPTNIEIEQRADSRTIEEIIGG